MSNESLRRFHSSVASLEKSIAANSGIKDSLQSTGDLLREALIENEYQLKEKELDIGVDRYVNIRLKSLYSESDTKQASKYLLEFKKCLSMMQSAVDKGNERFYSDPYACFPDLDQNQISDSELFDI